jgi:hypothetical protein
MITFPLVIFIVGSIPWSARRIPFMKFVVLCVPSSDVHLAMVAKIHTFFPWFSMVLWLLGRLDETETTSPSEVWSFHNARDLQESFLENTPWTFDPFPL